MEMIQKAKAAAGPYVEKLDKYLEADVNPDPFVKFMAVLSAKTHIRRLHIFLGLVGILLFTVLVESAFPILSLLVGFVYPAYMSFKAIESKEKDDDTQWLTYWVVFATLTVVELASDLILSVFPFYYVAKLLVLVACMWPDRKRNLSTILYSKVIRVHLMRNERFIDAGLAQAHGHADAAARYAKEN